MSIFVAVCKKVITIFAGLQECANNITNYSCERVESMSSLTSRDSKTSYTGSSMQGSSMQSASSSSCSGSSSRSRSKRTHASSTSSVHTSKSVDVEVMRIQDRLIFPPNIPVSCVSLLVFFRNMQFTIKLKGLSRGQYLVLD